MNPAFDDPKALNDCPIGHRGYHFAVSLNDDELMKDPTLIGLRCELPNGLRKGGQPDCKRLLFNDLARNPARYARCQKICAGP